jgi:hypothetical protein
LLGEVEAGDLKAVEEEAGAAGIDVVGGDALENFADRGLDRGAVFGQRQMEAGAAVATLFWIGDRFSGGVVVVAKLFLTQARTLAAAAVGEDVAALVLFFLLHLFPSPRGTFVCKVFGRQEIGLDFGRQLVSWLASQRNRSLFFLVVKNEGPALAGPFLFSIYFKFYRIGWN